MSKEPKTAVDKFTLPLSKPITAHGEEVTKLEFKAPSGEDLLEVGAPPFILDDKGRTHIDLVATGDYIVRLAGVPLSSVKMMAPPDFMGAFRVVAGFFGGSETTRKKSSDDISS
jgi:hypothetical protein